MPGEQSWPTQPVPTKPEAFSRHTFTVEDISPYLAPADAEALKTRLLAATNKGMFTPITYEDTVHAPTSNGGALFGGTAAEPTTGAVYVVAHDNPGILHLVRPGENAGRGGGGAPAAPPGQAVFQQECQVCHGADRLGTGNGVALVYATADAANNIPAGAPRFDAATIRAALATGKGRMPSFPHLTNADVDNLVALSDGARRSRGKPRGRSPVAAAVVAAARRARAHRPN